MDSILPNSVCRCRGSRSSSSIPSLNESSRPSVDFTKEASTRAPVTRFERESTSREAVWFAFSTGNLSDCRKLYFDEERDVSPRYRIIYRLLPDEESPTKAEVIRIGLKVPYGDEGVQEDIYRRVGRALDRISQGRGHSEA